jgi:hypothetical protein
VLCTCAVHIGEEPLVREVEVYRYIVVETSTALTKNCCEGCAPT